jgi:acetylglutamate kinase
VVRDVERIVARIVAPVVVKIGGNELDDGGFVSGLIDALRGMGQARAVAVVHGGGKAIARLQERLSLQPRFVDGLRVTDDESLDVAEMVLSGLTNKRLVGALVSGGVTAVGLSGVDGGLFRVVKMAHATADLGWVGEIVETNPAEVEALLSRGVTPVISPISLGLDGHTYNVNADHAACALACALGAVELAFVSNVPGVLLGMGSEGGGECVPALTSDEVESLIGSGEIRGGMVPKVRSAVDALGRGVGQVRITNLAGLVAGGGTCFMRSEV